MKKKLFIGCILLTIILAGCGKEEKSSEENVVNTDDNSYDIAIVDVYYVTGRGTVVTGIVENGNISVGDEIQISGETEEIIYTTVEGLGVDRELVEEASEGMNVEILLGEEVNKEDLSRGQVITPRKTNDTK